MLRPLCFAVPLLLVLAVSASATAPAIVHQERQQDKRTVKGDAHLMEAAMGLLAAEGGREAPASGSAAKKDSRGEPYMEGKSGGAVATQADDQSPSSGGGSGEHSKEEGGNNNKEGEKQAKSCLTKEECHKKKIICGKGCTLLAHSKCAAKCSKSCVPTC